MSSIVSPEHVRHMGDNQIGQADRLFYVIDNDGMVMEWDGYFRKEKDGKEHWMLLIRCPRCEGDLTLRTENKKILVDEKGLHIDGTVRCTHPAEFGGMCSWCVGVEPPSKQSDRIITHKGHKIKIDAVTRRA